MSDDLVRRLCGLSSGEHSDHTIGDEAADEITLLRAERERLREAIKAHNEGCEAACKWKHEYGHCAYRNKDGSFRYHQTRCSDCPEHDTIEVPEGAAK